MQPQLTLVTEVQVAFFTLTKKREKKFKKKNLNISILRPDGGGWPPAYMVGLFSSVDAQVALQRLQVPEARSTDLAWIWLLARVD